MNLPKTIVITKYSCEECGQVYDSYNESVSCETEPVPLPRFFVTYGDKFVERVYITKWDEKTRQRLARNIDEIPIWNVIGISHQVFKTHGGWVRKNLYVLADGQKRIRVGASNLEKQYYCLAEGQRDRIVNEVLGLKNTKLRSECPPERLAQFQELIGELIARATS